MLLTLHPGGQVRAAGLGHGDTRTARRPWRGARAASAVEPHVVELTWPDHRPGTAGFAHWAAELGQRIDECGLAATADDLDALVLAARDMGVALVAADVLADPTQPEPARHRAFAHVVSALAVTPPPPISA